MVKVRSPHDAIAVTLAMPRWAYNPGTDRAPDREPLEAVKKLVPLRFDGFVGADDAAFRYGLALHDAGFFWEAHEIWEAVWKAAPMNGRDRLALRALIQIANAGLKQRQARSRAAARLMDEAKALLGELIVRGVAAEPESVAGRLRGDLLQEELQHRLKTCLAPLARFFSWEKMKETA
jgi:predicted metal-dependent hydrolase